MAALFSGFDPHSPSAWRMSGVPAGRDAQILAEMAVRAGGQGHVHIASDDLRGAFLAEAVAFFEPGLEVLLFPAWDCLPYDRISPNPATIAQRVETLTRLMRPSQTPRLILTTAAAFLQKVPPREAFESASLSVRPKDTLPRARLEGFLARNGYVRASTVREPGEFAFRGDIVDLYPPGRAEPVRIDLFGDDVETIRSFDPLSQMTTGRVDGLDLLPMSEVLLDEASIARFRAGYRDLFGAVVADDPLYTAMTEGRKHPGYEHWLPLFHPPLVPLLDYLPRASVSLDHQLRDALAERAAQIDDFYQARLTLLSAKTKGAGGVYKPVPPDRLFLGVETALADLTRHAVVGFSPFQAADPFDGQKLADGGARQGADFAAVRLKEGSKESGDVFRAIAAHISTAQQKNQRVLIACYSKGARDRLAHLLADHGGPATTPIDTMKDAARLDKKQVGLCVLGLEHGFESADLMILTEQDILGDRTIRKARTQKKSDKFQVELSSLNEGDFVVHKDHGIGQYSGLVTMEIGGSPHDCLKLVYDGGDKLFLPVENMEVLSRYGDAGSGAVLDKLGGAAWQGRKARVKKRLKDMADALLKIAAERALRKGDPVAPDTGLYEEFVARFPYAETEDQDRAIGEVIGDLASGRPMDRLVCGDVGFGKTEVALRAAFVAAMGGMQVAVMVPTTLLARQHYRSFVKRFAGLPVRIGQLSRMVTAGDSKLTKKGLADGTLDIVVGTHALLAKTISFARLGLVIVDEEQHFGVKQKERLKELRADVHVLTLTATPIPRTLQLAMAGVRELSLIATPPIDRLAVRTFVLPYDPLVIRDAIMREHYRGGQVFYVCPRLEDLPKVAEQLAELVPEAKVITAHGQMAATELEDVMTQFDEGRYDILLSTNIVESGLDIPNANTIILHRAHLFGLAQLYQLRGRVGRAKQRGYAYITTDANLTATAVQRLQVIETLDTLGAGFQLASHDMDIRGAGNLLGEEQSGHIREVGIELYQQMLEDAVDAARRAAHASSGSTAGAGMELEGGWTPQINLGMAVLIPESYVADLGVRLGLYRRLSDLVDRADLDAFGAELIDRFGPLPEEVENLLQTVRIKHLCKAAHVERCDAGPKGAVLTFHNNSYPDPAALIGYLGQQSGTVKLRPDQKLVAIRVWEDGAARMKGVQKLLGDLAALLPQMTMKEGLA
jgi:transcription-repair coupling factor (superfamily II helicase)